jgi:chemotaxis protein MotA
VDKTTIPGLVLGIGAMLVSVLLEGGSLGALLNLPAAVLVIGGTLGTAMISFPFTAVMSLPKYFVSAAMDKSVDARETIEVFVQLADRARREGLLALEQRAQELEPFAKRGMLMVVDGNDPSLVREVLETEISATERRHRSGYALLEAMGGFAPTMGIIGTVMGLVNVLSHLSDPSELGHSIATAFIATLYGVGTANLMWLPLANKLKQKSAHEAWLRELVIEGVMSVQAGDNPRVVREKLEAQLAPSQRGAAAKAESNAAAAGKSEPSAPAAATQAQPTPAGG